MSTPGNGRYVPLPWEVLTDGDLSLGARLLYGILQGHWGQGGECWASHPTLAEEMGVSARQLQRYLDELLARELIAARHHGRGQGKAYRPTRQMCRVTVSQPDTSVRLVAQHDISVALEEAQHDISVIPNTTDMSDTNSKKRINTTDTPDISPDPPTPQTGEVAEVKAKPPKVTFRDLSEDARIVVDDWRKKQGRTRPPDLNPALAQALEVAVVDLGVERLCQSNTWAAESQIPELIKMIRGARSKRKREEEGSRNGTGRAKSNTPWRPSTLSEEDRAAMRNWRSK